MAEIVGSQVISTPEIDRIGPKVGDTYITVLTKFAGEGWIDDEGEVWSYRHARVNEAGDGTFRPEMFSVRFPVEDVVEVSNGVWVHSDSLQLYHQCMAAVSAGKRTTGDSSLDRVLAGTHDSWGRFKEEILPA